MAAVVAFNCKRHLTKHAPMGCGRIGEGEENPALHHFVLAAADSRRVRLAFPIPYPPVSTFLGDGAC